MASPLTAGRNSDPSVHGPGPASRTASSEDLASELARGAAARFSSWVPKGRGVHSSPLGVGERLPSRNAPSSSRGNLGLRQKNSLQADPRRSLGDDAPGGSAGAAAELTPPGWPASPPPRVKTLSMSKLLDESSRLAFYEKVLTGFRGLAGRSRRGSPPRPAPRRPAPRGPRHRGAPLVPLRKRPSRGPSSSLPLPSRPGRPSRGPTRTRPSRRSRTSPFLPGP